MPSKPNPTPARDRLITMGLLIAVLTASVIAGIVICRGMALPTVASILTVILLTWVFLKNYVVLPRRRVDEIVRQARAALARGRHPADDLRPDLQSVERALTLLKVQLKDAVSQVSQSHLQAAGSHAIVEQLPIGILICDRNWHIIYANEQATRMLACRPNELVDKPLRSIFPDYSERRREDFIADMENKASQRLLEVSVARKDGRIFPADITVSKMSVAEGSLLIAAMIDVQERKELERLKKEFVAVVSHDLKAPLTTVGANLHMLGKGLGGTLNDDGQQLIDRTQKEIKRLMNLIVDILDIEKMEAGKYELNISSLPLLAIIEASEDAVSGAARAKRIEIEVQAPDIEIEADGERIVQVLINLLSNAIKFSDADSAVKVFAQTIPGWLEVKVIDRGRGIPQKYKYVIFEKFRQVTRDDGRLAGGSGLGLPICKAIVEQHGGRIGFESNEQTGTTFWFQLPHFQQD